MKSEYVSIAFINIFEAVATDLDCNVLHHWHIELFCIFKTNNLEENTDETATSAGLAAGKADLVLLNWKQIKCPDDL